MLFTQGNELYDFCFSFNLPAERFFKLTEEEEEEEDTVIMTVVNQSSFYRSFVIEDHCSKHFT